MSLEELSQVQLFTTCSTGLRSLFSFQLKSLQVKKNCIITGNKLLFVTSYKLGAIWEKGFLEWLTWQMVKNVGTQTSGGTEVKILKVITEPFTNLIIQVKKEKTNYLSNLIY